MMIPDNDTLQSRAEFYLCLAHAFLTPNDASMWHGLRDAIADDLADIASELGYAIDEHIADYRTAIAELSSHAALLQAYSTLFLAPPRPVSLNTGSYLDGAVNGGSVLAIEEAYRRSGLVRNDDFHDLPDHLAIQLEFVASRYLARFDPVAAAQADEDDAGIFLGRFVAPALPAFIADLERSGQTPNPWLPLARALQLAVLRDASHCRQEASEIRQQTALGKARHDRAANGIGDADMAFIAQRLSERGLATDHLAIAPEQRDEAQGWTRRVPPSPRRGSRCG
jgi:TorA maturation chaperone TorD